MKASLAGRGPKPVTLATALAFQFASTNLVWELGLVLWVLIGWQFALAEYFGGILLIALMAATLRLFVSPRLEEQARRHAREAQEGEVHEHGSAEGEDETSSREKLAAAESWTSVAVNFRSDWRMLWKGDLDRVPAGRLHRPARLGRQRAPGGGALVGRDQLGLAIFTTLMWMSRTKRV